MKLFGRKKKVSTTPTIRVKIVNNYGYTNEYSQTMTVPCESVAEARVWLISKGFKFDAVFYA